MKDIKLVCTNCQESYPVNQVFIRCAKCNEPLEVELITHGKIIEGNPMYQTIFERYAEFFPFDSFARELTLGEGFTPLTRSTAVGVELGLANLYFKNETFNPTWSFKDRGTALCVQHAKELGYQRIGTVSTGNMATSVAAYGSRAGMETFIFVSKQIAAEKLNPIGIYNPHLIKVDGDYGNLYFESLKLGQENDIYFMNSDVPFRVEGSKTIAFEICEQLGFENLPDYVVVPTSAGGNLRGIEKGFREFEQAGLIGKAPKIIVAQAAGCSPIYNAFQNGAENISRVANPQTIAHAIENPFPPSGNQVLRRVRATDGRCVAVSEAEIIAAQAMMAQEGIFGQPASAVPVAAVKKLKEDGFLTGEESVVCIVTGSGLKYTAALEEHNLLAMESKLEDLSSFIASRF